MSFCFIDQRDLPRTGNPFVPPPYPPLDPDPHTININSQNKMRFLTANFRSNKHFGAVCEARVVLPFFLIFSTFEMANQRVYKGIFITLPYI